MIGRDDARQTKCITLGIRKPIQQLGLCHGVGGVFGTVAQYNRRASERRRVIHSRQAKAQRSRNAATIAIYHVVAQGDWAVVVEARRNGEAAISVIHHDPMICDQARNRQEVSLNIAESCQQRAG